MTSSSLILLVGYAGKGNFGDEMMIEAAAGLLSGSTVRIVEGGIPMGKLLSLLWQAERIVVCGGHVIAPRHGSYLRVLIPALLMGKAIRFVSIEMSGMPRRRLTRLLQWLVLAKADISVRTAESAAILRQVMPWKATRQVVDLFYLHPAFDGSPGRGALPAVDRFRLEPGPAQPQGPCHLIVLPRSFGRGQGYNDNQNAARITDAIRHVALNREIHKITVSPSANVDDAEPCFRHISNEWSNRVELTLVPNSAPLTLDPGTVVITNRLHLAKACLYWGIEVILVSYDRKTEAPELVGHTGSILQLDGSVLPAADLAISPALLDARRHLSLHAIQRQIQVST